MNQENKEVTREDLKVNALLERIAQLEGERAEMRADYTILAHQYQEIVGKLNELETPVPDEEEK